MPEHEVLELSEEFLRDIALAYAKAKSKAYKDNKADAVGVLQIWANKNHEELMQAQANGDKKRDVVEKEQIIQIIDDFKRDTAADVLSNFRKCRELKKLTPEFIGIMMADLDSVITEMLVIFDVEAGSKFKTDLKTFSELLKQLRVEFNDFV